MQIEGNPVHYVNASGAEATHGQCHGAFVTDGRGADDGALVDGGSPVDLHILHGVRQEYRTGVVYSPAHEFGTWHLAADHRAPVHVIAPPFISDLTLGDTGTATGNEAPDTGLPAQ